MKNNMLFLILIVVLSASFVCAQNKHFSFDLPSGKSDTINISSNDIYVSATGNDTLGDGRLNKPYKTIQRAIDIAQNGNIIIVLSGVYKGWGNINLDFQGKEIVLRSENPLNPECLRNTIIDAEGYGLIARFIKDETKKTIFSGFSLICGDTNNNYKKGVPGFFEFSNKAIPTINNIKILGNQNRAKSLIKSRIQSTITNNWNNPFIQPLVTSDFYGSGDVNNDGILTMADVNKLTEIINNNSLGNVRCDVDGNGQINNYDRELLFNSINDSTFLPAYWDFLTDRTQRNDWIDKMLQIDKTNENLYDSYFQCVQFSWQLYFHFNHYIYDGLMPYSNSCPFNVVYNGGQSIFNLPMYWVTVNAPNYGHNVNAILIGDNPLNIEDWRFIEPQNDCTIYPGDASMPYNSDVIIHAFNNPTPEINSSIQIISFHIDEQNTTLVGHDSTLVIVKPNPITFSKDNQNYQWYPNIILSDTALILYEQTRDDMTRISDLHFKNIETESEKPVTFINENSFLLDFFLQSDTLVHLLFTSKLTKKPGVYYGKYSLNQHILYDTARISSPDSRIASSGKLIISGTQIYAF